MVLMTINGLFLKEECLMRSKDPCLSIGTNNIRKT